MTLTAKQDYVFIPKVTLVLNGVTFATVVGTRKYMFIIPFESIAEVGRRVHNTKFSIDEKNPQEFLPQLLASTDMNVAQLEEYLMDLIEKNPQYYIEIASLAEFNIKAGFFSKGVYYKRPGDRGFTGFGISGKENALALKEFYGR